MQRGLVQEAWPQKWLCLISSINEHLKRKTFFLLTLSMPQTSVEPSLGPHKTRNKSRGTHCGVEANISGKFFLSFAPYKEQGKGLKSCAHPPTASVPVEGGSTPSLAHQWSQFLSEEKEEEKELLLRQGEGWHWDRSVKRAREMQPIQPPAPSPPPPLLAQNKLPVSGG